MRVGVLVPVTEGKSREVEGLRSAARGHETAAAVSRILSASGHRVAEIPVDRYFAQRLMSANVDIVFNTYSGGTRRAGQFQVCAVMDLLGVRYTGSYSQTHALGLAKHTTKKILGHDNLPTPAWQTLYETSDPIDAGLRFPAIVKPACEGSSAGISDDSVVHDEEALRRVLARTLASYGAPVIVEEYIEGGEFTVGVLGNSPPRVLPVAEVDLARARPGTCGLYSHELKARDLVALQCPARVREALRDWLHELALAAFRSLECRDYARVDFRVDVRGQPYILELNTLPGLQDGYSDFPRIAAAAGYTYPDLILALLEIAAHRHGLQGGSRMRGTGGGGPGPIVVRGFLSS